MKCAAWSCHANAPRRTLIWSSYVRTLATAKVRKRPKKSFEESSPQADESFGSAPWTIVQRPILETLLKSYARHATVAQPLILHGPRGVGKRSIIEGLLGTWNKSPHTAAYVDLCVNDGDFQPWTTKERFGCHVDENETALPCHSNQGNSAQYPTMAAIRVELEQSLELLVRKAVEKGYVSSENVRDALLERSTVDEALRQFRRAHIAMTVDCSVTNSMSSMSTEQMWSTTVEGMKQGGSVSFRTCPDAFHLSNVGVSPQKGPARNKGRNQSVSSSFSEEPLLCLTLAKELLRIQENWKISVGVSSRRQGLTSKASADAATNWVVLLLRLLSFAAAEGLFQPKLLVNNLDLLRNAAAEDQNDSVCGSLYHDSLLMSIIKMGVTLGCIPVIFISSDSYYSRKVFIDHGDELAFISQEALGWTPEEAALHLVPAVFEESEFKVMTGVLGANARHLAEVHAIWQSPAFLQVLEETTESAMGDCVDLYLGYLQVSAVDPAMDAATEVLVKFAADVTNGKVSQRILRHGVAWRRPPAAPHHWRQWAKLQLLDYIQALADTGFAVNHRDLKAQELLEDPATNALLEVGLLYQQRELPYIRPLSRGVARCLVRWYVREKISCNLRERLEYTWHRLIRGRFYKQLMIT